MNFDRFWTGFFEHLFIRPMTRGTGVYVVVVTEYDAEMTAPFCYTYNSKDLCVPYVYMFNRYVDAINFLTVQ